MVKEQNKTKVLFIGPYPPPYSGPELGMKLFLESHLKEAFDIKFLKTNFRKTNINKARLDLGMVMAFFRFVFVLFYMIMRYRPVLAYYPITPTQVGWVGRDLWCLFICRLFGVKTVVHLRGGHLKLNFKTFHPLVQSWVRRACRTVTLALVQAECLRDQFEGLLPNDRIMVLYQAIESDEYDNSDLDDFDPRMVFFMGHLTQAKGYCDLVRTIPLVAAKFPNVRFYFAGTMRRGERGVFFDQTNGRPLRYEDPFEIEKEIKAGPYHQNYIGLGVVSGRIKLKHLKSCTLFLLPSYSEGFSRAVLEGMSMGKPIICTPVGAHREIIQDGVNGFVVEPGNVQQLADRIITILSDHQLRTRMAVTNYRYVREKFDIQIIAEQMEKYLERAIDESYSLVD